MITPDPEMAGTDPGHFGYRVPNIIDFLPDATFVIDTNGIVIAWNRAMEALTGVPAESMLGKGNYEPALPFYKERRPMLANFVFMPYEDIKKRFDNVERTGDTLVADFFIPDFRPGGAFFWAKAGPLYDPEGNVTMAIESLRDITERKRAERALMESEEKYHELVENANSIILKWDRNGSITFFNEFAQRFFGFANEEIIGKPVVGTIVPPTESGSERDLRAMIDDIIRHPENHILNENENITRDKRRVWIQWHNKILLDENGQFTGLLSIGTDITEHKQAERALRESEERYRTLFENSGSPLVVIDEDNSIVQLNHEYELLSGYRREDVEGRSWTEFIADPSDIEQLKEYHRLRRMNPDTAPATYEWRIIDRNGSIRNVIITATMIHGTHQSLIAVVDITARKRAEDELHALLRKTSEDMRHRYLTIFENSGTGMAIIEDDGTISLVNSMFGQITGWSRHEVEHCRSVFSFVVPEERDDAGIYHQALREEGENALRQDEIRLIRRDGSIRNSVISGRVFPGTRQSILSLLDITERKRMEDALRESEERFRTLTETSLTGIYIIQDGIFRYVNHTLANIMGYQQEEMIGKDPLLFVHPDDQDMVRERIQRRLDQKETINIYESRFVSRDNRTIYMSILGTLIPYEGRDAVFGNILDLTEQKKVEDALRMAHKKITMLSSITRHDIRNQMVALRGFIDLSRIKEKDPEILRYIEKEDKAAEAISEQIEFSKAYEEIGVNSPEWQNIPELIRKSCTQLLIQETITVVIEMPPLTVFADRLIEKVFYNLMENTLRHGGDVSMIRFSFVIESGGGAIVYEDNGVGVSLSDKPRLFEKGFGKNTGLGLFLSREILAITGITIRECGEPGKGVRFEIVVPEDGYRLSGPLNV